MNLGTGALQCIECRFDPGDNNCLRAVVEHRSGYADPESLHVAGHLCNIVGHLDRGGRFVSCIGSGNGLQKQCGIHRALRQRAGMVHRPAQGQDARTRYPAIGGF